MLQKNTSNMSTQAIAICDARASPEAGLTTLTTAPSATEMNALGPGETATEAVSKTTIHNSSDDAIEKPTGPALYILLAAVFSSGFLMALNGSMVATVR